MFCIKRPPSNLQNFVPLIYEFLSSHCGSSWFSDPTREVDKFFSTTMLTRSVTSGAWRLSNDELWEEDKKGREKREREKTSDKEQVTKDKWRVVIDEQELMIAIVSYKWRVVIEWQIEIVTVTIVGEGRVTRGRKWIRENLSLQKRECRERNNMAKKKRKRERERKKEEKGESKRKEREKEKEKDKEKEREKKTEKDWQERERERERENDRERDRARAKEREREREREQQPPRATGVGLRALLITLIPVFLDLYEIGRLNVWCEIRQCRMQAAHKHYRLFLPISRSATIRRQSTVRDNLLVPQWLIGVSSPKKERKTIKNDRTPKNQRKKLSCQGSDSLLDLMWSVPNFLLSSWSTTSMMMPNTNHTNTRKKDSLRRTCVCVRFVDSTRTPNLLTEEEPA